MSALLSVSLHEYMTSHKIKFPTNLCLCVPFSLRQPVADLKHFKMNNDMVGLPFELAIIKDLSPALKSVKKSY
jgi:hypothetical protein